MNNKGYNSDWLESLKFNNDVVSVIGKYVTLNQKGKTHWGCCPFHTEKTPSFAVNQMEGYYKCFGCGASGDVITFIEKIESVDFMEAVKILADNAGMEIPAFMGDENIKKTKEKRELIYKANKEAAIYYNKMLNTLKGKTALDYLLRRGVNTEIIRKFGLGVSTDWTSLITHLKSKGFKEELLKEAGLIEKGSKGNYYDIMAERLMFPIINSFGNVIGFSARALGNEKFAKYRNTSETPVFNKSSIVYGVNLLKKLKQANNLKEIIIVEGQMDVIALHSAGFENTVACMGTALTKQHAKELKRFASKIIISFDGDFAGQKATLRSLDILEEAELDVYVVSLPEKLDPDDYIKKYGKEAYKKLLNEAMPLNDYKFKILENKFDFKDNNQVRKYVKQALIMVSKIKNTAERPIYLKLISEKTKIDVYSLERELGYITNNNSVQIEEETTLNKDTNFSASEFILASLVHKKPWVGVVTQLKFENQQHNKLYELIKSSQNLGKTLKVSNLFDEFEVETTPEIKNIINYNFNFKETEQGEKYFKQCLVALKLDYLIKKQKELTNAFSLEQDKTKKQNILIELSKITKEIQKNKMEA